MTECANTIVKIARNMFHVQNLDKSFWAETVVNTVYTRNHCPTRALYPLHPRKPKAKGGLALPTFMTFGYVSYAMMPDERRGKLDAKDIKCLFLGYCEGTKAYRLVCLQT